MKKRDYSGLIEAISDYWSDRYEYTEKMYDATGNNIYIWETIYEYLQAYNYGKTLPFFVIDYLLDISKKICDIQNSQNVSKELKKILEISGNDVKKYKKFFEYSEIFKEINELFSNGILKKDAAEIVAGKHCLGSDAIIKKYYRYKKDKEKDNARFLHFIQEELNREALEYSESIESDWEYNDNK